MDPTFYAIRYRIIKDSAKKFQDVKKGVPWY